MLRRMHDEHNWKPWIKKAKEVRPTYPNGQGNLGVSTALVLFVRILHEGKSEVCTLRDLHDGMKVYQVKAELELLSGIPTSAMDLQLLSRKSFQDDDELTQGKNVSFGDTIRVNLNSEWNQLLQSVWKGSLVDVKRFINLLDRKIYSTIALPNADIPTTRKMERHEVLSQALFVASHRGDEKISKLLLRNGASTTYITPLGNTSLHTASSAGHISIVQLLVAHGANVRVHNMCGKSPLDVAVTKGYFDCARWLWFNQWSLSITKNVVSQPYNASDSQSKISQSPRIVPEYPKKQTAIKTEYRLRPESSPSRMPTDKTETFRRRLDRPHTAYVFSQQLSPNQNHASKRSLSARTTRREHPGQGNDEGRKVATAGSQSEKSKRIVSFLTSHQELQQSIPSKSSVIPLEELTKEVKAIKVVLPQRKDFYNSESSEETLARVSKTLQKARLGSSNVKNRGRVINKQISLNETTCQYQQSTSLENNYETSDSVSNVPPQQSSLKLDVEKTTDQGGPAGDNEILSDEIFFVEMPETERKNGLNESVSELAENLRTDGYEADSSGIETSPSPSTNMNLITGEDASEQSFSSDKQNSKRVRFEIDIPDSSNSISTSLNDNYVPSTEKGEYISEIPKGPRSFSQSKTSIDVALNEDRSNVGFLKDTHSVKRISKFSVSTPNTGNHSKQSLDKTINDHERDKRDRNRKAFEIWLAKKRKNQAKRKGKEVEEFARQERKQSLAHRTSSNMTFDEWLQMKKEEEITIDETEKIPAKAKKKEIKYGKTYDDWKREKEEEKRSELEKRMSNEAEQKLREEQDKERRKKEYDKKMEEWNRKKEEMKRDEHERRKQIERMTVESASLMYEEWLGKPRVKSFEDWKREKSQESRLNEVSKAQKATIEKQEREMEEIRNQIAKEKFQQWVMKKDLTKLKSDEVELEKAKKRRKDRKSLRKSRLRKMEGFAQE